MVEGQRPPAVAGVGHDRPAGVVAAAGAARGPGHEHGRDRVQAGVAGGIGVRPELAEELDLEPGLLAGFAHGGRFEGLAVVDETAGQGPAGRRIPALDEDDAPAAAAGRDLDDDVDGRDGIAELGAGHGFRGHCTCFPAGKAKKRTVPAPTDTRRGQARAGAGEPPGGAVGTNRANIVMENTQVA